MQPGSCVGPWQDQQDEQHHFIEAPAFTISNYRNQHSHPFHPNLQYHQQQDEGRFLLTNQLFPHHYHHFQPFEQQQQQEDRVSHLNFKFGLNENSPSKEGWEEEENPLLIPRSWHRHEDSTAKERSWKPLTNNDKRGRIEHEEQARERNEYHKLLQYFDSGSSNNLDNRLFNELEAIYGLSKMGEANQTGSGSSLSRENWPANAGHSLLFGHVNGQNVAARGTANATTGVDLESEISIGEEAALRKSQKRKRKRYMKENLGYIAGCLESFVRQVMDHQEKLHCKFLGVIERMEKERTEREEARRHQEAALHNGEAMARAHEQALASNRTALIVSYIEKITGKSINLPKRKTQLLPETDISKQPRKQLTSVKTDTNSRLP
ncbi:hypothetical protein HS088_TW04G00310 [Tripterygium wilfordii]|uniref:Uncharacterized protein n=1 Tax=Tripterygium wilfordii TaxID=458696 RepID=A0A7J7DPW4_TRIWF|nr:trihelix transcription factor GTL2-like [Tripterygium wilfordii]KAF5748357.1 hypothetical protein HS088_TW04G00310 [Tripterygium wilfordii]